MEKKQKYLIKGFIEKYLDLNKNKEDEQLTVETIRNGVEFKGANLWILIFVDISFMETGKQHLA